MENIRVWDQYILLCWWNETVNFKYSLWESHRWNVLTSVMSSPCAAMTRWHCMSSTFIETDPSLNSVRAQFAVEVGTFRLMCHTTSCHLSCMGTGGAKRMTELLEWNTEDLRTSCSSTQTLKVSLKWLRSEMDLSAKYHLQRESFCYDPRRRSTFQQHHTKIQPRAWSHFEGLEESYFAGVELSHFIPCKRGAPTFKRPKVTANPKKWCHR